MVVHYIGLGEIVVYLGLVWIKLSITVYENKIRRKNELNFSQKLKSAFAQVKINLCLVQSCKSTFANFNTKLRVPMHELRMKDLLLPEKKYF